MATLHGLYATVNKFSVYEKKTSHSRTKRADLQQICNRSILTKTDQLQTNLSSAESVLSLLQTLSLNILRVVMPADEKQTTTDLQIICSVCR